MCQFLEALSRTFEGGNGSPRLLPRRPAPDVAVPGETDVT